MEQETQDQLPDLSVDDAAAALGFSTTLSDTMLQPMLDAENMPIEDEANTTGEEETQMEMPVESPQQEEMSEELEEEPEEDGMEEFKGEIKKELDDFKKEIKDEIRGALKEVGEGNKKEFALMIKKALSD